VSPLSGRWKLSLQNGKLNPINTSLDFTIAPYGVGGCVCVTLFHITVYGANQMMVHARLPLKIFGDAKKSYLV